MAGTLDPAVAKLRALSAAAQALANEATEIAAGFAATPSAVAQREHRLADLLGRQERAVQQLRLLSDRLVGLESSADRIGMAQSAPTVRGILSAMRVHLSGALAHLAGEPPPAPGCHPRLVQRLERKTAAQELEAVDGLDPRGEPVLGDGQPGGAA